MMEIEAFRIGEKINVYGRARAEALPNGPKDEDVWYVVVNMDPELEWDDEKLREVAERFAPSAAMIQVAREDERIVITSVPKSPRAMRVGSA